MFRGYVIDDQGGGAKPPQMKRSESKMTVEINGIGKITANKRMLNLISKMAYDSQQWQAQQGYDALAEQSMEISDEIYDRLKDAGYYERRTSK